MKDVYVNPDVKFPNAISPEDCGINCDWGFGIGIVIVVAPVPGPT